MANYSNPNGYQNLSDYQYMQPVQTPYAQTNIPVSPSVGALPPMPTGYPTGPAYSPMPTPSYPTYPTAPMPDDVDLIPDTVLSPLYTQGYLKKHIGRRVKIEFLIGTNMLVDREGTLVDVGTSYVVIQEAETDDLVLADLYSIKFVKFYY